MPALSSFDYVIIRVVPSVERGECINAGVILFCRTADFLGAEVDLDVGRLAALAPQLDPAELTRQLEHLVLIARGDPRGGTIARLSPSERFHWLTAPRSTVIQPSPIHSGLSRDPAAMLDHLLNSMVRNAPAASSQ